MSYSRVNHFIIRLNETNIIEEDKATLIKLFNQMEEIYSKIYPNNELPNFMYLIKKLVELIGKQDIYEIELKIKSLKKIKMYDQRWKRVMDEMI